MLVAFSAGSLACSAFLGLFPEAVDGFLENGHSEPLKLAGMAFLAGIFGFFALEKLVRLHHCHDSECHSHGRSAAKLIFFGDGLHNFLDGVLIATSFSISIPVGIGVSTAVIVHEIAHEIGDFAIFLHAGFSRRKAILWNLASGLPAFAGAGAGMVFSEKMATATPWIVAVAGGGFVYIALADLLPELHRERRILQNLGQFLGWILGAVVAFWVLN